jgi:hypothetical protein
MPTLYFGWLNHPTGSVWALQRQNSTGTAQWPLKGFWLGATKDITLDGGFGLLVSGGVFLPRRAEGSWVRSPDSATFGFEIPSYEWWNLDGMAKIPISGNFDLLCGVRWDHKSTRVDYTDNTSDDYILNSYIPLIGAQFNQRFSNGALLVRVVGSPIARGRMKYNFWTRSNYAEYGDFDINSGSSFLEVLADYRVKVGSELFVGGFAKWNSQQVRTGHKDLSGSTNESVSWAVDIRSWTVGADVSLDFACPF